MNEFKKARDKYNSIPIPEELKDIVTDAIHSSECRSQSVSIDTRKGVVMRKLSVWKVAACICVVAISGVVIGLNSSNSFAKAAADVPILGSIAKVFTFREYSYEDDDKSVTVEVPNILSNESVSIEKMNQLIQQTVKEYEENATNQIKEYKEAFIATGGTEQEFKEKDIKVDVSYTVKCQTEEMLSIVLEANENWCSAYNVVYYYNLNPVDGSTITLKDILGENYIDITNKQILNQMKEREAADENITYFGLDMSGFTTISDNTNFYINDKGNAVIVFAKYEVAPGSMGPQEFEIMR